ncbi:hypothetical protein NL676_002502 [Syzygium grande]|nr:hypothetical protein NL676_002502 [Syzygium grande]
MRGGPRGAAVGGGRVTGWGPQGRDAGGAPWGVGPPPGGSPPGGGVTPRVVVGEGGVAKPGIRRALEFQGRNSMGWPAESDQGSGAHVPAGGDLG